MLICTTVHSLFKINCTVKECTDSNVFYTTTWINVKLKFFFHNGRVRMQHISYQKKHLEIPAPFCVSVLCGGHHLIKEWKECEKDDRDKSRMIMMWSKVCALQALCVIQTSLGWNEGVLTRMKIFDGVYINHFCVLRRDEEQLIYISIHTCSTFSYVFTIIVKFCEW